MKLGVSVWSLALVLALVGTGCKQQALEKETSATSQPVAGQVAESGAPEAVLQEGKAQTTTLEGILTYQDLEGGVWQLNTQDGLVVLRNAPGCHDIPEGFKEGGDTRVQVTGRFASGEGQMGIHMAGSYFEVERMVVVSDKQR